MKNIIILNIQKTILAIIVIFVASACEDSTVEKKFDESYTERIQGQISELRTSLMASENGWKALYITDKDNLGGFNFLFDFIDENTVMMASDFSREDTVFRSSEYTIKDASTVKLSFSTANAIHKLSDSNNSPIPGEGGAGYKGDVEFLYYGKDGEDLIFRGNRTNGNSNPVEIRFVKAEREELGNVKQAFEKSLILNPLLGGSGGKSVYSALSITKDGVETIFSYDYKSVLRSLTVENSTESFSSPIYFTKDGFVISKLVVGEEEFTNVEVPLSSYDAAKDQFTVSVEKGTIVMGSSSGPVIPVNGHKQIINPRIVGRLGLPTNSALAGLTTASFLELYNSANVLGFSFYNDFTFSGGLIDYFFIPTSNGTVRALYTYKDQEDRIVFVRDGYRDAGSVPTTSGQEALLDFLFDSEGFYVENLGSVTRFSNHVYTFTSVQDPSIRIALFNL